MEKDVLELTRENLERLGLDVNYLISRIDSCEFQYLSPDIINAYLYLKETVLSS
jgi:hypothetical protein